MGRSRYKFGEMVDFRGGLNLEPENAPANQLQTAKNVWAPNGRLLTRPGFVEVVPLGEPEDVPDLGTNRVTIREDLLTDQFFVNDTDLGQNLATDHRLYIGLDRATISGFSLRTTAGGNDENIRDVLFMAEYYAGSKGWLPITLFQTFEATPTNDPQAEVFLSGNTPSIFRYVVPCDWQELTIDPADSVAISAYYIRFTFLPRADNYFEFSIATRVRAPFNQVETPEESLRDIKATFAPQFPSGKRYLFGGRFTADATVGGSSIPAGAWGFDNASLLTLEDTTRDVFLSSEADDEPASIALVPLFDEAYVAYNYTITRHTAAGTNELAVVEDGEFIVGETLGSDGVLRKADYNPDYVDQLAAWPRAKYTTFFDGRIFVANLQNNPYEFRWSAPVPAQRVWPTINFDAIDDDDNSPITGLSSLNENLLLFKNDSIWQAVAVGDTDIGEAAYVPQKIASGIGTVSNSSIVRTPLGLMFLAEDGVYLFNGSPAVQKLSENIDETFLRVTASRRRFAAATHYKTQNCYLLSVSVDGSPTNNLVLCYDYKHGAWYEWEGLNVETWLSDEDVNDDERIYFGDANSQLFELAGFHDNGCSIEADVKTHRMLFGDFAQKTAREVRVNASNSVPSMTVELQRQDDDDGDGVTGPLNFYEDSYSLYGQEPYAGKYDFYSRQLGTDVLPGGSTSFTPTPLPEGPSKIVFGFTERIRQTDGVPGPGSVTIIQILIEGYDEEGRFVRENPNFNPEDQTLYTSETVYAQITQIAVQSFFSGGPLDARFFMGYGGRDDDDSKTPKFNKRRRRDRRWTCRVGGEWFNVRLTSSTFGRPLELHRISLGFTPLGRR